MSKIYKTFDEWWNDDSVPRKYSPKEIAIGAFNSRQPEIDQLKARIAELENVLKDFLTTSYRRTWIEEMKATISDVLD